MTMLFAAKGERPDNVPFFDSAWIVAGAVAVFRLVLVGFDAIEMHLSG